MESAASDFLILLATVDPAGTLALFVGLTTGLAPAERRRVAVRAVGISGLILLAFVGVGQVLLGAMGIRLASFQLAGAIIFFLFGVQMVFGTGAAAPRAGVEPGHDPAVFPIAVPSIASPGAILAAVVLTDNRNHSVPDQLVTALMLLLVLGLTLLSLLAANRIHAWLGDAGSTLAVRILGLILAAMAVDMGHEALLQLWGELP